jgi:hypothetical protein
MTWYARVPDPHRKGKIHYFSLGTISKSEAKLLMQQRIKEGAYDIKDEAETMTLQEVLGDGARMAQLCIILLDAIFLS